MDKHSYLGNADINTIEELFKQYQENPENVEESWRSFFKGFEFARTTYDKHGGNEALDAEFRVINLIEGYRKRGHLFTKTNPVRTRRKYSPTLDIQNFDLTESDLDSEFQAGKKLGIGPSSLRKIIDHLETTYCANIGAEYMFIRDPEKLQWLQNRLEKDKNTPNFSVDEKKHIYYHLRHAVGFEQFIHKKFMGQKRFSLEGAESLIPALDAVIERGAELGISEFVIGMAHRGRLNVLTNILKKPYQDIFNEFLGEEYEDTISLGDVKYHLGYNNKIVTDSGQEVKLNLVPNPSHLETVGAVVQGISRARIDYKYNRDNKKLAPIVIHGDAAIASQGVVYEVLQMSHLPGYKTGGTIHLVINNQVGFTTNYLDARSSTYCTDIAKVTKAPIFHVNGDDAEALMHTIQIAMEYRQQFHTDVFIDILCYRKYGHNEGDEPRFTQPVLYKAISKHPNVRDIYAQELIDGGVYSKDDIKQLDKEYADYLETELNVAKAKKKVNIQQFFGEDWKNYHHPVPKDFYNSPKTSIDEIKLLELASKVNYLPEDKSFFKKIVKLVEDRRRMVDEDKLDWALGELLAYASLVDDGYPVRVSGQDSERGTFSHRHAAYVYDDSTEKYIPLKHISENQANFEIYNSPLSEYGVMGFEYGYALTQPNALTIWEAQFGDFHNVAQVIIDQYLSSAEEKWGIMNGLTLLLPHGFEGQGPEHSSARIERFLTLAANENMQIVNPTTPANMFHLLRRQMLRDFRVPLVVFTPKSLLRHPQCTSTKTDFTQGAFQEVIDDANVNIDEVTRVVLCSGKIYYDLLAKKNEYDAKDIALVRVEQLHPFPMEKVKNIIKKYTGAIKWLWVQEEPENMGAWWYIKNQFKDFKLEPVTRLASGSPAVGLNKLHVLGQEEIIEKVFRKCTCHLNNKYCGLQCIDGSKRKEIQKQFTYL